MNLLAVHGWAYQLTGGRIGHRLGGGVRAALLTTTGRKTGRPRTVPLAYFRDGAGYVFVASNHGSGRPAWLVNAQAKTSRPIAVLAVTPA
jgi:deazaflavin-dependent oxidoreductase (nitroreductase family)